MAYYYIVVCDSHAMKYFFNESLRQLDAVHIKTLRTLFIMLSSFRGDSLLPMDYGLFPEANIDVLCH